MSKRNKIVIGTALIGAVLSAYYLFFGIQTVMTIQTRVLGREAPFLSKRPIPVTDIRLADAQGARLSYLGFSLEAPWVVDASRTKATGRFQLVAFTTGNAMLIANPPKGELASTLMGFAGNQPENLRNLFGENVLGSDFLLLQTIYNVTPSDVQPFASRKDDASRMVLLTLKALLPPEKDSRVFSIQNAAFQGFQLGDPANRPRTILLQLFSNEGELNVTLVQKTQGPQPAITQADLNRIIRTVRKVEPSPDGPKGQAVSFTQSSIASAADDCGLTAYPISRSSREILADAPHGAVGPPNADLIAKAAIDAEGRVTHLRVLRLAYPKAETALRNKINIQAVDDLKKEHYPISTVDGKPVAVCVDLAETIDLY